jgi:hypothetical protein
MMARSLKQEPVGKRGSSVKDNLPSMYEILCLTPNITLPHTKILKVRVKTVGQN